MIRLLRSHTNKHAHAAQVFHGEHVGGAGPDGHAFEARLYAESPRSGFLPGASVCVKWVALWTVWLRAEEKGAFQGSLSAHPLTK
jgi:hypothetical protein